MAPKKTAPSPLGPPCEVPNIAIVGYTPSRLASPPVLNPDVRDQWEIWGINDIWRQDLPDPNQQPVGWPDHVEPETWDRWFDMHHPDRILNGASGQGLQDHEQAHLDWLRREHSFPIYTIDPAAIGMPSGRPYPINEMAESFREYWTNSITYEVALASLLLTPHLLAWADQQHTLATGGSIPDEELAPQPTIAIHGVNMANDTEYSAQRPSCEYIIGRAEGFPGLPGVRIVLPNESHLLKCFDRYGYDRNAFRDMVEQEMAGIVGQDQRMAGEEAQAAEHLRQIQLRRARLGGQHDFANMAINRWAGIADIKRDNNPST